MGIWKERVHTRASSILCVLCSYENHHENVFHFAERQRFDFPSENQALERWTFWDNQTRGGRVLWLCLAADNSRRWIFKFRNCCLLFPIRRNCRHRFSWKIKTNQREKVPNTRLWSWRKKRVEKKSFSNTFENIGITLNQNSKIAFIATAGTLERDSCVCSYCTMILGSDLPTSVHEEENKPRASHLQPSARMKQNINIAWRLDFERITEQDGKRSSFGAWFAE